MSLTEVNQSQHHHDERLQQNDQNVEQPPAQAGHHLSEHTQRTAHDTERKCVAAQERDQEEQQFASIHVAEKSHPEGHGLRHIFDEVEDKVEGPQEDVVAERSRKELVDKSARTLISLSSILFNSLR